VASHHNFGFLSFSLSISLSHEHTHAQLRFVLFACSASVDGRIYVWKIDEGPDDENKPQITGKIEIAIQIGDAEIYHPRICWHSHKQVEPHRLSLSVSSLIFC
jgi:hypothetical protein